MNTGKLVLAAIFSMAFGILFGMVTCGGMFNWVYSLEPTNVWKANCHPGVVYYAGSFILHLILAFVYALLKSGIPGKTAIVKGLVFGLCVWAVGTLPGMFATYSFMTVAPLVIGYWTLTALIVTPLSGLIIAMVYGK